MMKVHDSWRSEHGCGGARATFLQGNGGGKEKDLFTRERKGGWSEVLFDWHSRESWFSGFRVGPSLRASGLAALRGFPLFLPPHAEGLSIRCSHDFCSSVSVFNRFSSALSYCRHVMRASSSTSMSTKQNAIDLQRASQCS